MKEFNLDRAIAGDKIIADGDIGIYKFSNTNKASKLLTRHFFQFDVTSGNAVMTCDDGGTFFYGMSLQQYDGDVFMAPVKKQEWGYIWKHVNSINTYMLSSSFGTEAEALKHVESLGHLQIIKTVLLNEWEE